MSVIAQTTTSDPRVNPQRAKHPSQFKFSTWVHVGPDADACDDVNEATGVNSCSNPAHFHSWLHLPNDFQHNSIRDKAFAAKARRVRQLNDRDSDPAVILDAALDDLRAADSGVELVIDALVEREDWKREQEALSTLAEEEGDEGDKVWATVEEDRQRFLELADMPVEERDEAEYTDLDKTLTEYENRVLEEKKRLEEPLREALAAKDADALFEDYRRTRVDQLGIVEFTRVYAQWAWFECALQQRGGEPTFSDIGKLHRASPEVIDAIRTAYNDLEMSAADTIQGN